MSRPISHDRPRRRPPIAVMVVAALAGFAVAAIAGIAVGKSFTLRVVKNAHVTNAGIPANFRAKTVNTHEAIAVGPTGYAVYTFQGETTHHLKCKTTGANGCLGFWPPVSVKSAKGIGLAPGIKGKLGTFHRGKFGLVLTLNGQPLYYFTPDIMNGNKRQAAGDELNTFGSIWHVVKAAGGKVSQAPTSPQPTVTMTTSSTTPYVY